MTSVPAHASLPFAFDGVVRLTRTGTTFIIFTVVIGFAALNTGNNALYIGLTFMLGSLLLSGLASKGGLRRLEVTVDDLGEAWAGRPTEVVLRIGNRSRIWNVRDIILASEDLVRPVLVPLLPRGEQAVVHATLLFHRRGRVELKHIDLYTRYPFGLFMKKRRVRLRGELIVFPRLLDEPPDRDRFQAAAGEQAVLNRPGAGSDIHSFREFAPGDSLRHVYWRKSASQGRWIIKQTQLDAARGVHVVIDPFRPRGVGLERFERMISEAATFIHDAQQRGLEVTLQLPGLTLRSREARAGQSIFRALALIESAAQPAHLIAGRHSVLFSVGERT